MCEGHFSLLSKDFLFVTLQNEGRSTGVIQEPGVSRLQSDSGVFLQVLRVSSLIKINSQLINTSLWCCAPTSNMDCKAAAKGAFVCFQPDIMIITANYYYYYYY